MKKVLVLGAAGYIGNGVAHRLSKDHQVIGVYHNKKPADPGNITWEQADVTDQKQLEELCKKHIPDVVFHSAAIAHEKIATTDRETFRLTNGIAQEYVAKAAAKVNPDVQFIFISGIIVYGEKDLKLPVSEDAPINPAGDNALFKVEAEERLMALHTEGILKNLVILRLAPVFFREWSFNLERRTLAPLGIYIRFGSGKQTMSAIARPNLADFVNYLIKNPPKSEVFITNVTDKEPYTFSQIIKAFKQSGVRPNGPTIYVPLPFVWIVTRIFALFNRPKKEWLHACYDKLACDLIFDNSRMLSTGYNPEHSLETEFARK